MFVLNILAALLLAAPPAHETVAVKQEKSIRVDSRKNFAQSIEGTLAPESVVSTLELIEIEYYGFDDRLHRGQMVVHRQLAGEVREIFDRIRDMRFPIEMAIPIKVDLPDNGTTMDTLNNTMSFHYRAISTFKTDKLSYHSFGTAIDINPFQNPAILKSGRVIPEGAAYDPAAKGTLTRNSEVVKLFLSYGWEWGGSWRSLKDYMHFEKPLD